MNGTKQIGNKIQSFLSFIFYVCSINSEKQINQFTSSRPFVDINVGQSENFKALVDSGAMASCIDDELAERIRWRNSEAIQFRPFPDGVTVSGANGNDLRVTYFARIKFKVLGRVFIHPFVVVKGLNCDAILGNDFIATKRMVLRGNGTTTEVGFDSKPEVKVAATTTIPARSVVKIPICTENEIQGRWIFDGAYPELQFLDTMYEGSGEKCVIAINPLDHNIVVNRRECIGTVDEVENAKFTEVAEHCKMSRDQRETICKLNELSFTPSAEDVNKALNVAEVNIQFFNDLRISELSTDSSKEHLNTSEAKTLEERKERIKRQLRLDHLDPWVKRRYEKLILDNVDIFSLNKYELGRTNAVKHKVRMSTEQPVHKKQFRLAIQHTEIIDKYVDELKRAGCIELSTSPYNSPIFIVQKKDNSPRIVLDYRDINFNSLPDKYIIRDVKDCCDTIGQANCKIFSTLDLTSSFWQLELDEDSKDMTCFTVPGKGRFRWTTMPMGLHGSSSSFARLMDLVMAGLKNVVTYIDDVICFSKNHDDHLIVLQETFDRLRKYNLKLNPRKCDFGAKEVDYLGFKLGEFGIRPGDEKTQAIEQFPEPNTLRKVRQFYGLCNFFRDFIPNFASVAAPLSKLTTKNSGYSRGKIPKAAQVSFCKLRDI